ncbi:MAG: hypothetical protein C5B47_05910 [Verrucomicrobia bacterium]|nr:MAG: hypothetical protein C5B47_05910 [Verrucomicrobiota bacterium]
MTWNTAETIRKDFAHWKGLSANFFICTYSKLGRIRSGRQGFGNSVRCELEVAASILFVLLSHVAKLP